MRITKASIRKIQEDAAQQQREALCKRDGHKWRPEVNGTIRYCETCFHLEKMPTNAKEVKP